MAINFLWANGTSNSGLITPLLSLITTEANSLANNNTCVSTVGGTSGLFSQTNTTQGIWGELFLTLGAIGTSLSSNSPNLSGWFLTTPDSGTTIETPATNASLPRPPDFIIPLPSTTITAGWVFKATELIQVPSLMFKTYIQNNSGQGFSATGNSLKLAVVASQY